MENTMTTLFRKHLLALAVTGLCVSLNAFSAEVPAGTELAEKQHLTMNIGAPPNSYDPAKLEGNQDGYFARQVYETLVISNPDGSLRPGVAESWEHSDNNKTWTFHLRKNAKWSNGDPVLASDFVFAWQRLAAPETAAAYVSYLDFLKLENSKDVIEGKKPVTDLGVEAKDDHTLVLHLSESVPFADKLVEHYVLAPVHQKSVEKYGDKWTDIENLVFNGAFMLRSATINEKYELVRNPFYWENDKTVLDSITFLSIPSPAADYARYRADNEDIAISIPIEAKKQVTELYADQLVVAPMLCTYMYELNHTKPPLNDVRVRKALSLAFERNIVTDKILQDGQTPAYVFSPPAIGNANKISNPEWASWDQAKRNAEAVKLLKEAGFDKNNPVKLSLLYNTSESHQKLAVAASSFWKKNLQGAVEIQLENQEWKTFLDSKHRGNYQIARQGWCADYNEASTFLTYYLSNNSQNDSKYASKEYDEIIAKSYQAKSDDERQALYAEAEKILDRDAVLVPVYHYVNTTLIKPYVKGYASKHPQENFYLKDTYIIKH